MEIQALVDRIQVGNIADVFQGSIGFFCDTTFLAGEWKMENPTDTEKKYQKHYYT